MNALYELFGEEMRLPREVYMRAEDHHRYPLSETQSRIRQYAESKGIKSFYVNKNTLYVLPEYIVKKIDNEVAWAYVYCDDPQVKTILPSKRSVKDIEEFISELDRMEYDDGFGSQRLFGQVVFKDGTWMERREYDGSEWWEYKSCPKEPDWTDLPYLIKEQD